MVSREGSVRTGCLMFNVRAMFEVKLRYFGRKLDASGVQVSEASTVICPFISGLSFR